MSDQREKLLAGIQQELPESVGSSVHIIEFMGEEEHMIRVGVEISGRYLIDPYLLKSSPLPPDAIGALYGEKARKDLVRELESLLAELKALE